MFGIRDRIFFLHFKIQTARKVAVYPSYLLDVFIDFYLPEKLDSICL